MEKEKYFITNDVISYIETKILSGEFKPGSKLPSEHELSKMLSISRGSVHVAIQQMNATGVLESKQGKGTFVKFVPNTILKQKLKLVEKTETKIRKMMELRIILEGNICLSIAPHISDDVLNELDRLLNQMELNFNDINIVKNCDYLFHKTIYSATNNEFIINCLDVVFGEIVNEYLIHYDKDKIFSVINDHKNIYKALKNRNGKLARKRMIKSLAYYGVKPLFDIKNEQSIIDTLFVDI